MRVNRVSSMGLRMTTPQLGCMEWYQICRRLQRGRLVHEGEGCLKYGRWNVGSQRFIFAVACSGSGRTALKRCVARCDDFSAFLGKWKVLRTSRVGMFPVIHDPDDVSVDIGLVAYRRWTTSPLDLQVGSS